MKPTTVALLVALFAFVAGCAADKPKRDPYADAALAKRTEIDRLSKQLSELRGRPDSASFSRQIDSLEAVRSVAQASLGGIGGSVDELHKMDREQKVLNLNPVDSFKIRKSSVQSK